MARRTRMTYEYKNEGQAAVSEIAAIAAKELDWSKKRLESEVSSYLMIVDAGAKAALESSDKSASLARGKAPSVVTMTG